MKKTLLCLAVLVVAVSGCVASSHMTVGPATVQSSVATHEYRAPAFYVEDGKMGSTLGFWSSEVGVAVGECTEASLGGSISWDQDKVAAYPNAACAGACAGECGKCTE